MASSMKRKSVCLQAWMIDEMGWKVMCIFNSSENFITFNTVEVVLKM